MTENQKGFIAIMLMLASIIWDMDYLFWIAFLFLLDDDSVCFQSSKSKTKKS